MVATILLTCGVFALLRTGGFNGDGEFEFHWRWTPTPEQRLLAQAGQKPLDVARGAPASSVPRSTSRITEGIARRQGFGHDCDTRRRSVRTKPNAACLPSATGESRESNGPAFVAPLATASFATCASTPTGPNRRRSNCGAGRSDQAGHRSPSTATFSTRRSSAVTTRSSRAIRCPRASRSGGTAIRPGSGSQVERRRSARTPTLSNGRVYTFGATGILNALDAATGAVVWSRNAAADAEVENPGWGFASSPLVVNDLVIVAASGRLAAYDVATGQPRWFGPTGGRATARHI